ncbi:MAG: transporter suffix domain-containing protein [Bacteroidales bacterium]
MKRDSRFMKITGFVILTIACLLFLLIPVVPWLGFSAGKIAGISVGLLIAGEVLFYLSLFILGRSYFDKIKSRLKFWIKRIRGTKASPESE